MDQRLRAIPGDPWFRRSLALFLVAIQAGLAAATLGCGCYGRYSGALLIAHATGAVVAALLAAAVAIAFNSLQESDSTEAEDGLEW